MKMKLWINVALLVVISVDAEVYSGILPRNKRQLTIGFGLPQFGGQPIQGAINSFLGGLFGNQNQNQNPDQGQQNPFGFLNQFVDGGGNQETCDVNNGGCEQGCRFLRGRVHCHCNPGYFLNPDGKKCSDIDECSDQFSRPCQESCQNTVGSFTCACSSGGSLLPDGRSCGSPGQAAIPSSCAVNNGGCEQVCRNRRQGGIACRCRRGFVLAPDKKSCLDLDECSSGQHNCGPLPCINTLGSFQCQAAGGCFINNGGCEHHCRDTNTGPVCTCENGFKLRADRKTCINAQTQGDCSVNNGGCSQTCRNTRRGPRCRCRRNFVLQPDGQTCFTAEVPDPCAQGNGGCQQICVNNQGTVQCQCQPGFTLVNGNLCQQKIVQPVTPRPPTTAPLQQERGCGVNTKKSLFRRIVGGKPADPKDWPWMAALLRSSGTQQFCGGSLITDRHVLTAAHCVNTFSAPDIVVRLGVYDFSAPNVNSPTDFTVAEIRKHESYSTTTQENDVAILKLGRPATFNEAIWPACLPPPNNDFTDQLGYVIGAEVMYICRLGCGVLVVVGCVPHTRVIFAPNIGGALSGWQWEASREGSEEDLEVAGGPTLRAGDEQYVFNWVWLCQGGTWTCIHIGWGTIHFGGPVSNILQEVVIPVWKQDKCKTAYPNNVVADSMMCAGQPTGGKDSCQGDSGGPFLAQIFPETRWYVAGIVSWGIECASPNRPGVYTRVNKYLDWIRSNSVF